MPLSEASVLIRAGFPGVNSIRHSAVVKAFLRISNAFCSVVVQLNGTSFLIFVGSILIPSRPTIKPRKSTSCL